MSGTDETPDPADVLATGLLGRTGAGTFTVEIGRRWRERLLARCLGHRRSGAIRFGLTVTSLPSPAPAQSAICQRWVRSIDGRSPMTARSTVAASGPEGALVETFLGGVRLVLKPAVGPDSAQVEALQLTLALGPVVVPLPARLLPHVTAQTHRRADGLWGRVSVRSRSGGDILSYEGVLS